MRQEFAALGFDPNQWTMPNPDTDSPIAGRWATLARHPATDPKIRRMAFRRCRRALASEYDRLAAGRGDVLPNPYREPAS